MTRALIVQASWAPTARPTRNHPEINRMEMNRDYLDLLRRLRMVEMPDHERRAAQREMRRAVFLVEFFARVVGDRGRGSGRLVPTDAVALRRLTRGPRAATAEHGRL
jgi:hypothetical protein